MPLIYVLRHGQTNWNAEWRMQGHTDIPLNDKGRTQAAKNGRVLATLIRDPYAFDFVSSPLSRATETMEILRREIGADPKSYRTDPRLREINLGDWEGHVASELLRNFPELMAQRNRDPWNFLAPGEGAESYAMLSARVLHWLGDVGRDAVVTAHGGVVRCLRKHLLGLDDRATFEHEVPQDRVLRIADGTADWL